MIRSGMLWICSGFIFCIIIVISVFMYNNRSSSIAPETFHLENNARLVACLKQHVIKLSDEIGERHYENPGSLQKASDYIMGEFKNTPLLTTEQVFDQDYRNIIAETKGTRFPDKIIVIGAHYDTVWLSPGADDNASGVAVLLELARIMATVKYEKTLRFIAFSNEEQPFSGSDAMGSVFNAQESRKLGENINAMYSLEMVGYYSDKPGSQKYPSHLEWFYPDKASFIAFVANPSSGFLLMRSLIAFRKNSDFPSQALVAPEALVPDIRRSDHASFWDSGYPAIMITDTADYRNINYHTVGDVPGTLNYENMALLTRALARMFAALAVPGN